MFDFIITLSLSRYLAISNELHVVPLVNINIVVIETSHEINLKLNFST